MLFMKYYLIPLLIVLIISGCSEKLDRNSSEDAFTVGSLANEVNKNLDKITGQIDKNDGTDSIRYLSSSSNPYDYTKDNPYYDELISAGYDVLPVLEEKLNNSSESGLREYIMCIAIEEIAGCNLKQFEDSQWDSAKNFKLKWDQYLKEVPVKVENILKSSKSPEEKEQEIAELGSPAIPYVIRHVNLIDKETNSKLSNMMSRLIKNGKPAKTVTEFKKNNEEIIQKLQEYVENR